MFSSQHTKLFVAAWVATSLLLFASLSRSAHAQGGKPRSETTNMTVVVKEADTGQPISQARLTLQFTAPGGPARFGKSEKIAYSAKTDTQGRYKFSGINKGTIVLTITAAGHQSYGKELQLEKDNQVFEVKLKKPQPLI
ncbi:MAG: carboxypeptidase-like regulatory domain-containing protein [Terriglobia bacterium]|jgi:Flp pilus assembly protein CpaB